MIIKRSELISIKSTMTAQFKADAQDAEDLNLKISALKNVVSEKTNFEGEIFEKIGAKLEEYISILTKRINLANDLSKQISSSLDVLISAMKDSETIDTSKKEALESNYLKYINSITYLEKELRLIEPNEQNFDQIRLMIRNKQYYARQAETIKKYIDKIKEVENLDRVQSAILLSFVPTVAVYNNLTKGIAQQQSKIAPRLSFPNNKNTQVSIK